MSDKRDLRLYYYENGTLQKMGTGKTGNNKHLFSTISDVMEYCSSLETKNPRIFRAYKEKLIVLIEYTAPYQSKVIAQVYLGAYATFAPVRYGADYVLNYPSALYWMWDYCTPLGSFVDSIGRKFDLGIHQDCNGVVSAAIVYGDEEGQYYSGELDTFGLDPHCPSYEFYEETRKRAAARGLYKRSRI